MAEESMRSPRRRPVDVLFGEEVQLKPAAPDTDANQTAPGYMVEPPRPVTSVRPPPPEFPSDWRVSTPPEPVVVTETSVAVPVQPDPILPPPKPVMAEPPPVIEPIAEAVTFTTTERKPIAEERPASVVEAPVFLSVPPPAAAPAPLTVQPAAPASLYGQTELLELSQFVDQLYQNVADETSDSAVLNAECLANLNAARTWIEKSEYAKAEAAAELVKARLLRARSSRASAAAQTTRLLFGGLIFAALVGIVLFAIPLVLRIVPVVIPLLRSTGLGMLGGAAIALYQLTQHISRREYDAAFNSKYALSPLFGALVGAVMYLLSLLGILAAPNALGIPFEYALMYLFALLGGVFNDALIGAVRGLIPRRNP